MQQEENTSETILTQDLNGTSAKSAIFCDGKLLRFLPPFSCSLNSGCEEIVSAVKNAVQQAGKIDRIAVSLPDSFDLKEEIFPADDTPVCFIPKANAFLLGELSHGAARGFLRVGGITSGTDLKAAFAIAGDLQNNAPGGPAAWKDTNGDFYSSLYDWKKRLDAEVIVLDGELHQELHEGENLSADLNIRFSELGEDAVLWGAYEYARKNNLPETPTAEQLRWAIVSDGNPALYQKFLQRAEKGESLLIGAFGGSITAGAACLDPEKQYHGVFVDYLRKRYPQSRFSLAVAGIGATDSLYGAFRLQRDLLDKKPDLVILDFAVNDTDESLWAQSYEGVIRQILSGGIPVIQLFMTHNHQRNCQRFQEVIGRHYGLAAVSYRDAVMPELMSGKLYWENLSPDAVHPHPSAHVFTGKLLCGIWEKISAQREDSEYILPEKLISDAFEHTFLFEKALFVPEENDGWRLMPQDSPYRFRDRLMADTPGSRMSFSFDGTSLWISYLGIEGKVGRVSVQVDSEIPVVLESYFPHDWADPKQLWALVVSGLPRGRHRAVITLLEEHHPSGGTEFYFCSAAGTLF